MLKTFRPKQGSVLVFSLIVLSILLSAAVAVATVSVANRRSTLSTAKSNQSFQVADSGVELVLQQIYKPVPTHANLNALATALGGGAACAGGSITKTGVAGGDVRVSFFDKDDNLIGCADTNWRSKIVAVKSEGTAFGTTRLVETAVAAGSDFGWVPIDGGGVMNYRRGANPLQGWYRYASGDHSPERMCVNAGYLYATGACKVTDLAVTGTDYEVYGAVTYWRDIPGGHSGINCEYSIDWSDADPTSMVILCAK